MGVWEFLIISVYCIKNAQFCKLFPTFLIIILCLLINVYLIFYITRNRTFYCQQLVCYDIPRTIGTVLIVNLEETEMKDTMRLQLDLWINEFAKLAAFIAGDANLVEESRNNGGHNDPKPFAELVSAEQIEGGSGKLAVTLEVLLAYDFQVGYSSNKDYERHKVSERYLSELMASCDLFQR